MKEKEMVDLAAAAMWFDWLMFAGACVFVAGIALVSGYGLALLTMDMLFGGSRKKGGRA